MATLLSKLTMRYPTLLMWRDDIASTATLETCLPPKPDCRIATAQAHSGRQNQCARIKTSAHPHTPVDVLESSRGFFLCARMIHTRNHR